MSIWLSILLVCVFGVLSWYLHRLTAPKDADNRRFYVTLTGGLCMVALFIGSERLLSVEGILMTLLFSTVIFVEYQRKYRRSCMSNASSR